MIASMPHTGRTTLIAATAGPSACGSTVGRRPQRQAARAMLTKCNRVAKAQKMPAASAKELMMAIHTGSVTTT